MTLYNAKRGSRLHSEIRFGPDVRQQDRGALLMGGSTEHFP
jgi:hypothetical protein